MRWKNSRLIFLLEHEKKITAIILLQLRLIKYLIFNQAEKLRESMLQISDGLNQWASKTLLVAEAYSKLANLIPDAQTQLSESKIFHGTQTK